MFKFTNTNTHTDTDTHNMHMRKEAIGGTQATTGNYTHKYNIDGWLVSNVPSMGRGTDPSIVRDF